jgi:hypothetical protein
MNSLSTSVIIFVTVRTSYFGNNTKKQSDLFLVYACCTQSSFFIDVLIFKMLFKVSHHWNYKRFTKQAANNVFPASDTSSIHALTLCGKTALTFVTPIPVSYKSISSESRGNRFGTAQIVAILS